MAPNDQRKTKSLSGKIQSYFTQGAESLGLIPERPPTPLVISRPRLLNEDEIKVIVADMDREQGARERKGGGTRERGESRRRERRNQKERQDQRSSKSFTLANLIEAYKAAPPSDAERFWNYIQGKRRHRHKEEDDKGREADPFADTDNLVPQRQHSKTSIRKGGLQDNLRQNYKGLNPDESEFLYQEILIQRHQTRALEESGENVEEKFDCYPRAPEAASDTLGGQYESRNTEQEGKGKEKAKVNSWASRHTSQSPPRKPLPRVPHQMKSVVQHKTQVQESSPRRSMQATFVHQPRVVSLAGSQMTTFSGIISAANKYDPTENSSSKPVLTARERLAERALPVSLDLCPLCRDQLVENPGQSICSRCETVRAYPRPPSQGSVHTFPSIVLSQSVIDHVKNTPPYPGHTYGSPHRQQPEPEPEPEAGILLPSTYERWVPLPVQEIDHSNDYREYSPPAPKPLPRRHSPPSPPDSPSLTPRPLNLHHPIDSPGSVYSTDYSTVHHPPPAEPIKSNGHDYGAQRRSRDSEYTDISPSELDWWSQRAESRASMSSDYQKWMDDQKESSRRLESAMARIEAGSGSSAGPGPAGRGQDVSNVHPAFRPSPLSEYTDYYEEEDEGEEEKRRKEDKFHGFNPNVKRGELKREGSRRR